LTIISGVLFYLEAILNHQPEIVRSGPSCQSGQFVIQAISSQEIYLCNKERFLSTRPNVFVMAKNRKYYRVLPGSVVK
jgi:hypothetical protein